MDVSRLTILRNALLMLASEYKMINTTDGPLYVIGEVAEGSRIFATEDGVPASNGTYTLEDGSIITTADGVIQSVEMTPNIQEPEVKEPTVEESPVAEPAAIEEPAEPEPIEEPAKEEPAAEPENKKIEELEAKIAELIMKIAALESKLAKVEDTPAAMPVTEEFKAIKEADFKGNKAAQMVAAWKNEL